MPRVLIIDDDQELTRLLFDLLASHEFESEIAKDAASARQKLKRRSVDLTVVRAWSQRGLPEAMSGHLAARSGVLGA